MKSFALPALVVLLVALTVACVIVGDGNVALAIAPAFAIGALYAVWKMPLRWPLLVTTFLALTLENPSDNPASGQWKSPLYNLGAILLVHLNVTLPSYKGLIFSGVDIILAVLFTVAVHRRLTGSRIDGPYDGERAGPIGWFAGLSLAAAGWMWLYGTARGDADVASSLWQVQHVAYVPVLVFLSQWAFRNARDTAALGKVIVSAACLKAVLAVCIRATVPPPPGEVTLPYATTHADSMLFAVAFCAVLALVIHRRKNRVFLIAAVLPLLVAGMVANGRRLAWVELAFGVATIVVLTPWSSAKRAVVRAAVFGSPIFLAYAMAGWNSASGLFAPVHTLRSVVDSKADPSTMWRDLENYNLFYTLRHNPLFGTGYGHGYVEVIALPDVSSVYALYRFLPHNAILGLWAYGGLLGFTALWAMLVVGLFVASRAYQHAVTVDDRTAAVTAVSLVVVYLIYCYGDLGLGTWTSVFTVAPALAIASKLAVTTGAWPARSQALRPSEQPRRDVEWNVCQSRG